MALRIALVLTLGFVVIGSVRFARFDWTGLPLDRSPVTTERQVGPCLEKIRPYVTESGREIKPVVVDEMQYLALVEYFRGVPRDALLVTCLYDPFTFRAAVPWIAHCLPFDEGLSLGLTTSFLTVISIWLVVLTLREQKFSPRVILAGGALFTFSWNAFYFGSGLLIDSGVVAALAACWYLLARNKPWLVLPIMAIGYSFRETFAIMLAVLWAWCWTQYREGARGLAESLGIAVAAGVIFLGSVPFWRGILPSPIAAWDVTPNLDAVASNLGDPIGLLSFAVATVPLLVPSYLVLRRQLRSQGRLQALLDPAVVGVAMAIGISLWTVITAAMTPRQFWIGYPFAVTLVARWFSDGRPSEWLDSLKVPLERSEKVALSQP